MKLLIVDDCSENVEILSAAMELSGHRVDEAYDGIEAIERLQSNSYDVVIVDAEMPRMGGVEVCKFLKSQLPDVFVIGISGCFRALKELKNAGTDICLSKPFHIDVVEEIIENLYCPA
jgi:two-component system alkaline phosphatase synthesis response regulator PhoP